MYSCDADNPQMLGVKIFESTLDPKVREYIFAEINNMASRAPQRTSLKAIRKQELKLLPHALLVSEANNKPASRKRSASPPKSQAPKRQHTLMTSAKRPFGV